MKGAPKGPNPNPKKPPTYADQDQSHGDPVPSAEETGAHFDSTTKNAELSRRPHWPRSYLACQHLLAAKAECSAGERTRGKRKEKVKRARGCAFGSRRINRRSLTGKGWCEVNRWETHRESARPVREGRWGCIGRTGRGSSSGPMPRCASRATTRGQILSQRQSSVEDEESAITVERTAETATGSRASAQVCIVSSESASQ
ncbi:hypothetical protein BDK51DRAFT_51542 [Blyttiomyces helicus]|uniref:Uncharacterized protein n=1 Tax=Blyttiomyces helicus TaxID=388810 RepID=A0A4P9W9A5_9FUNG|nr:hypothetical protein BDK51DRAFT_51542 [Blyttiomyces helicus]|eukprot:RKO88085.1 hypothetical protein BDK51DRAFT_51542 [Blyttiomyces helicus]